MKYKVETEKAPSSPGCWDILKCKIYNTETNQIVGEYTRNYPSLFDTFKHFVRDRKDYAFIGEKYNGMCVYSLDPFEKIYETNFGDGQYCPTEIYIPELKTKKDDIVKGLHAFLSGCYWGCESESVLVYFDLRDLKNIKHHFIPGYYNDTYEDSSKIEDIISYYPYQIDSKDFSFSCKLIMHYSSNEFNAKP